jgi:hypothetical protein
MWRREERLGFWLEGGAVSGKPDLALRLKEKLSGVLGLFQGAQRMVEPSLDIPVPSIYGGNSLDLRTNVQNGIELLRRHSDPSVKATLCDEGFSSIVRSMDLVEAAGARNLKLPDAYNVGICRAKLDLAAYNRTLSLNIRQGIIHTLECFHGRTAKANDGGGFIKIGVAIRGALSRISEIPYMRRSIDVDGIEKSERQSFLHEAEVLRQIPADRAEILAIYRNVPVEMISRLRYLDKKRVILYGLEAGLNRTGTQLHDMAAVLDRVRQEVHLVPHRLRFRKVFLN